MAIAHASTINKGRRFLLYNFICVLCFGMAYYVLQLYDKKAFVSNQAIQNQGDAPSKYSLSECFHFSLVTQTTIGYGGMIPLSSTCVTLNALQLLTIFFITATTF